MNPNVLAKTWRAEKGYTGRGGVVVIFTGVVSSWVNELRDPEHWAPGCIAVDEAGNQWVSAGGNMQRGALRWERVSAPGKPGDPIEIGSPGDGLTL